MTFLTSTTTARSWPTPARPRVRNRCSSRRCPCMHLPCCAGPCTARPHTAAPSRTQQHLAGLHRSHASPLAPRPTLPCRSGLPGGGQRRRRRRAAWRPAPRQLPSHGLDHGAAAPGLGDKLWRPERVCVSAVVEVLAQRGPKFAGVASKRGAAATRVGDEPWRPERLWCKCGFPCNLLSCVVAVCAAGLYHGAALPSCCSVHHK